MVSFKINRPGVAKQEATPPAARGNARSPRRRVLLTGMFHSLTSSHRASVRNLSVSGAAIECDVPLKVGAEGVLQAGQLDALCRVIWSRGKYYGLAFDQPLPNCLVLELHRVTEQDVKRAQSTAAKEWFESQAR
jgi:hypothetical protein